MGLGEVDRVAREFALVLSWRPFLLRPEAPDGGWDLPAALKARIRSPDNPLKARAANLGLTLVERDHIPSTRLAHRCALWADAQGASDAFHRALLKRYWSDGEDLSTWATLEGAAKDAGLDGAALRAAVEGDGYREALERALGEAREVGVSAVPTYVINDRHALQGAHEASTWRQICQKLGATPHTR